MTQNKTQIPYREFLQNKMAVSSQTGFEVSDSELSPTLFPHVRDTVKWAVLGGCRAIFSSFGMQKTVTQLEILRVIIAREGGFCLPCSIAVRDSTVISKFLANCVYEMKISIAT